MTDWGLIRYCALYHICYLRLPKPPPCELLDEPPPDELRELPKERIDELLPKERRDELLLSNERVVELPKERLDEVLGLNVERGVCVVLPLPREPKP